MLFERCLSTCTSYEEIWAMHTQYLKNRWKKEFQQQQYAKKIRLRAVYSQEENNQQTRKFSCLPKVGQI